jgi:hypothetical protein
MDIIYPSVTVRGNSNQKHPLLITLTTTAKSQEIFRLTALCHVGIRVDAYRAQNGLTQCLTANSLATLRQTASQLPVDCGAGEATCTRSTQERKRLLSHQDAVTASWRRERKPIPPIIGAADMRRNCRRGNHREHPILQQSSPQTLLLLVSPSRGRSDVA